jgi:tripartite-type tricarboxylate transporter receptor subunit TctC
MAVVSPGVLVVHPSIPVKNVKEFIAFARARPGELFFSSSGQGSAQHLTVELFSQMTGIKMTHVPYKGTAPSITDVVGGRIALTVASVISTRPMFTTGKLRALAVVGPKRTPALPDYPTIAESGVPGFGVENWYALFLPGGTNREIAVKVQQAVSRALTEPSARKLLLGQGLDAIGSTQEEFAKAYADEIQKWAKVVKAVGVITRGQTTISFPRKHAEMVVCPRVMATCQVMRDALASDVCVRRSISQTMCFTRPRNAPVGRRKPPEKSSPS